MTRCNVTLKLSDLSWQYVNDHWNILIPIKIILSQIPYDYYLNSGADSRILINIIGFEETRQFLAKYPLRSITEANEPSLFYISSNRSCICHGFPIDYLTLSNEKAISLTYFDNRNSL